jgi:hypothetical protein
LFNLLNEHIPDWTVIWENLSKYDDIPHHETSFKKQQRISFAVKTLFDELPTLHVLQIRKGYLYNQFSSCLLCSSDMETIDHIWTCVGVTRHPDALPLHEIINKTRAFIKRRLPTTQGFLEIHDHYVWSPLSDSQRITLGWFIRGVLPVSFVLELDRAINFPKTTTPSLSKAARSLANEVLLLLQSLIYKHRWLPRCDLFTHEEELAGISHSAKRLSLPRSITTNTKQSVWIKSSSHDMWIKDSIIQGGNSMGFMVDVNSVAAAA